MTDYEKYPNGSIYLSGSMEYAPDGKLGTIWREETSKRLKQMGFFPLDIAELDVAYAKKHGELFHSFGSDKHNLIEMKSNIRHHFVNADLDLITYRSDAVILLYDEGVRRGAGTISEAQEAYNHGLPIFIVNAFDSHRDIPGWLVSLSTKIFDTFDELYEYLESLPQGILRTTEDSHSHILCSLCGTPTVREESHNSKYCPNCGPVAHNTVNSLKNRYDFFVEYLQDQNTDNIND